ncbi:LpqN/LpqT family lipoprotein [Mycobacterium sp. Aquia_216]|uniref:LpqN/LpqT family lipoprotein n=1 Tax=Mycobacterium sp. Aquia_216 TaxID=2991729 RepID=UPI00227A869E|nr:LpqN/LpqT family lipoprotein [Mycobacterium sp. Aquia_216]WAJ44204.1 LpqN/LpqT family lipoprotein [Mycobacterium sp. Aquia_216]
MRRLAAAVAIAALTAACGPKTPDYQSVWTTSSTTATTTTIDKPVPLSQYLDSIGVTGKQVAPSSLIDLTVSIPTPPGWAPFTNPHIAPETLILAKGGKYPTARLVVFKLNGDFDPAQVIKHGNDDAQLFENFKQLDASMAPFNGFPSSMLQGSYNNSDGTRLHSWNRIVLPTGSPPAKQKYFVQLTITGLADQAAAQSTDVDTIIHGFVVAAK